MESITESLSSLNACAKSLNDYQLTEEIMEKLSQINTSITQLESLLITATLKTPAKKLLCLKCGETNKKHFNRKISECIQCMSKVTYEKRKGAIEKGKARNIAERVKRGECHTCGTKVTTENAILFDWDHRDPKEKSYGVAKMNTKSDVMFYVEVAKCDLVCKNCHAHRTVQQHKDGEIRTKLNNKEKETI